MKDQNPFYTPLLFLINLTVGLIVISFVLLLFGNPFQSLFQSPTYSKEELENYTHQRQIIRLSERQNDFDLIENNVHVRTGLIADENLDLVISRCTSCHSAQLITQNRATREGWKEMFIWMQKTQGLTDLGDAEPKILDYLAKHYAPQQLGRRANLDPSTIDWYVLDLANQEE